MVRFYWYIIRFYIYVVEIFRTFENMRDMKYMRDIRDMLYGETCFYILLIYFMINDYMRKGI